MKRQVFEVVREEAAPANPVLANSVSQRLFTISVNLEIPGQSRMI